MTHAAAVNIVASLLPDIGKRGPETVLSEYAERDDLPAAQLEKLAQVYNTMRTVDHIDKAASDARGDTIPLVDVPTLVVGYATGLNQEKAAARPHSYESHDVRRLDLTVGLRKAARLTKAAAQTTTALPNAVATEKLIITRDAYDTARLDLEVEVEDTMSKLASVLFANAPVSDSQPGWRDISEFEEEALQHQPAHLVKAAGDYLEKFAAPHRVKLERFDYTNKVTPYAYDTGHQLGHKMAELAKSVALLDAVVKMAAGPPPADWEVDEPTTTGVEVGADPFAEERPRPPKREEGAEDNDPLAESMRGARTSRTDGVPQAGDPIRPPKEDDPKTDENAKPKGKNKSGDGSDKPAPAQSEKELLGSMLAAGLAPVSALGSGVQRTNDRAEALLEKIVSKERQNTPQRAADLSVADIKRSMAIRRLIGTDPVLREADPNVVLNIYNTVAQRAPELAGDVNSLRLILREAVSYEGLTLDSQKLLADISKSTQESEKLRDENSKRQYAVGGVSPLTILKKTS